MKQEMKQITLCKGICSTSYLSKIESGSAIPSIEIQELLSKRLDLDLNNSTEGYEKTVIDNLFNLYKVAILHRDKTNSSIQNVSSQFPTNKYLTDNNLFNTYSLYLFRIYLLIDTNSANVEFLKNYLNEVKESLNSYQKFLLNLNMGIYLYSKEEYQNALEFLYLAGSESAYLPLEDWEKADYYYVSGLCNLVNNRVLKALELTELALKYYQELFIVDRIIDCYIVMSNAYKRNYEYEECKNTLMKAEKMINSFNLTNNKGILNQNLGDLHAKLGDIELSLEYYIKSFNSIKNTYGYLISILSIITTYSQMGNSKQVIEWSKKGLDIISEEDTKDYEPFFHHLRVYKAIHSFAGDSVSIIKQAIFFFESCLNYRFAHKYTILLAEYYGEHTRYRDSQMYYRKANQYLYKLKSIHSWEEL